MTSPTKIGAITNEISSFTKNTPNQGQVAKKSIALKLRMYKSSWQSKIIRNLIIINY